MTPHPLQSWHLGTSHSSLNCHQLPHHMFLNLTDSLKSLPSKVILALGKAEVTRHQIWAVGGLSHLGDLVSQKNSAQDVMHERSYCHDEAAHHQLPIAAAF